MIITNLTSDRLNDNVFNFKMVPVAGISPDSRSKVTSRLAEEMGLGQAHGGGRSLLYSAPRGGRKWESNGQASGERRKACCSGST